MTEPVVTAVPFPFSCRVCRTVREPERLVVREMMFGTREEFTYCVCRECEVLQIEQIPTDIGRHYPPNYGAYANAPKAPERSMRTRLRRWRNRHALDNSALYSAVLERLWPAYQGLPPYLRDLGLRSDSAVLDVGCGDGRLLRTLSNLGLRRLFGSDVYGREVSDAAADFVMLHKSIEDIEGQFDVIMLHHVLEHLPDLDAAFASIARLLAVGGTCVVRTPTVSSFAWREYREHWVQLDAPRHLHVLSLSGVQTLAQRHGLIVHRVVWDSNALSLWGSEQYRRGVPLVSGIDDKNWFRPALPELEAQLETLEARAQQLNVESQGDQFQVFLRKPAKSSSHSSH